MRRIRFGKLCQIKQKGCRSDSNSEGWKTSEWCTRIRASAFLLPQNRVRGEWAAACGNEPSATAKARVEHSDINCRHGRMHRSDEEQKWLSTPFSMRFEGVYTEQFDALAIENTVNKLANRQIGAFSYHAAKTFLFLNRCCRCQLSERRLRLRSNTDALQNPMLKRQQRGVWRHP